MHTPLENTTKNSDKSYILWDNELCLPDGEDGPHVGLAGVYSGIADDKILIAGGANFPDGFPWTGAKKVWWADLYCLDTTTNCWKIYKDFLPYPIGYGVSIQLENGFLCIGGCDSQQCYTDVFLIQINKTTSLPEIVTYPSLPIPLANAAGTILDNKIYIAGGQRSMQAEESGSDFFVLDLNNPSPKWEQLPTWPGQSRGYSVCVAQDSQIFLFGGRCYKPATETVVHTDGFSFDPCLHSWKKLDGEYAVMAGTAIPYQNTKIMFLGGVDELLETSPLHPGFSRIVRMLDLTTSRMDTISVCPYPIPVTTHCIQNGNTFYITSGEERPGIRIPHILKGIINP